MRIAVEREQVRGDRIIENGVRVRSGFSALQHLERLQVEHEDGAVAAGSREPVSRGICECHPVGAVQPGDLCRHAPAVGVDDHDPVLTRDEQVVADGIECQVVPAAVSAQGVTVCHVIGLGGSAGARAQENHQAGEGSCIHGGFTPSGMGMKGRGST